MRFWRRRARVLGDGYQPPPPPPPPPPPEEPPPPPPEAEPGARDDEEMALPSELPKEALMSEIRL